MRGILPAIVVAAIGCYAVPQHSARAESVIAKAHDQVGNGDEAGAIRTLRNFVRASIANPDIQRARGMLVHITMLYATRLKNQGELRRAVGIDIASSGALGAGEKSKKLRSQARGLIRQAYTADLASKNFGRALADAKLWGALFPSRPALAASQTLQNWEINSLAVTARTVGPSETYAEFRGLVRSGIKEKKLAAGGVDPGAIVQRYVASLAQRGWYRRAAAVASGYVHAGVVFAKSNKNLTRMLHLSLLHYCHACIVLGNRPMVHSALRLCRQAVAPLSKAKLAAVEAEVTSLGNAKRPTVLSAGQYLAGDGTWVPNKDGYLIEGTIQIGNNQANHGPPDVLATITVEPGVVLHGGTILLSKGTLNLKGTAAHPIILSHVKIGCEFLSQVTARFVLFRHCLLYKAGNYYVWSYSSKWALTSCLLDHTSFSSLSDRDWGIKFKGCTFLHCVLRQRTTWEAHPDYAALSRNPWGQIGNCDLYHCTIPVSMVWMMQGCNIIRARAIKPFAFQASLDLPIQIGTPAGPKRLRLLQQLKKCTRDIGVHRAIYTVGNRYRRPPSPLWLFVPSK